MKKKKKEQELNSLKDEFVDASDKPDIETKADIIDKKDKPKKEKKPFKPWQNFNIFRFIFEIFAVAALIVLGIIIFCNTTKAVIVIFFITAFITIALILLRFIVIVRKRKVEKKKKAYYIVFLVELLTQLAISILFIVAAAILIKDLDNDSNETLNKIAAHFDEHYPLYVSLLLYTAIVSYLIRVSLFDEYKTKFLVLVNIIWITCGFLLCAFQNDITAKGVAIAIGVVACIVAFVLLIDAGGSFFTFHNNNKKINEAKGEEKEKETDKGLELPSEDKEPLIDVIPDSIPKEEPENNSIVQ